MDHLTRNHTWRSTEVRPSDATDSRAAVAGADRVSPSRARALNQEAPVDGST